MTVTLIIVQIPLYIGRPSRQYREDLFLVITHRRDHDVL